MRTVNKILIDGVVVSYADGNTQFGPGSEQEAKLLQEITDGEAEFGSDIDRTPVVTVDELRIASYGSFGEQADMQYWDAVNSTTTWVDHIAAVKLANPK